MYGYAVDLGVVAAYGETGEKALLQRMTDTIVYRGPDDAGYWCAVDSRIGLGHRRPSIVDLSPLRRQPMCSVSGRYVIPFNGEIYNHLDLRKALGADFLFPRPFSPLSLRRFNACHTKNQRIICMNMIRNEKNLNKKIQRVSTYQSERAERPAVGRAFERAAQLAISPVGCSDVSRVAGGGRCLAARS